MPTPDYLSFARDFLTPRLKRFEGDLDKTRAHSFEQLNELARALRRDKTDPRVGLLEKTGGARVRDRAADIIAYDLGNGTCQLIDVIGDSEGEDGIPRAGWGEVPDDQAGKRPIAQWKAPFEAIPLVPHVYEGGENDTGICDRCLLPRADPIHKPSIDGLEALQQRVSTLERLIQDLQARCLTYGSRVGLRTDNNHVVSAQDGGGGTIHSDRKYPEELKSWETFRLENPDRPSN